MDIIFGCGLKIVVVVVVVVVPVKGYPTRCQSVTAFLIERLKALLTEVDFAPTPAPCIYLFGPPFVFFVKINRITIQYVINKYFSQLFPQ